jgi:hypothetical protein
MTILLSFFRAALTALFLENIVFARALAQAGSFTCSSTPRSWSLIPSF